MDSKIVFSNKTDFIFSTELSIRVCDLNHGNHLGNDRFVSLVHEARARFFRKYNWYEDNIDNSNIGIIMKDLIVNYTGQGRFYEKIKIDIWVKNIKSRQFEMFYLLTKIGSEEEIGRCMTRLLFFDYNKNTVAKIPKNFKEKIEMSKTSFDVK